MNKFILAVAISALVFGSCTTKTDDRPRVFVFTDINIDSGDPDDRQSLIHLLWYADELKIEGIVPDRWNARGLEACQLAVAAYQKDYHEYGFDKKGYPDPANIEKLIATNPEEARAQFIQAASDTSQPLYVLVWGNMVNFGDALRENPGIADNIRLITIASDLMMEEYRPHLPADWEKTETPCTQYNWNGHGRNQIFRDYRFRQMWWLEINWTYEGMFSGKEPAEMFEKLSIYGNLGQHMKDVVKNEPWARYFRVGDTPSVLYVIDPVNKTSDPTQQTWAGKYIKPFPEDRPNYYTDSNGTIDWNYSNPCITWQNHKSVNSFAKGTLEKVRPLMYQALLDKLDKVYELKKGKNE
jgi:hypothetical protein